MPEPTHLFDTNLFIDHLERGEKRAQELFTSAANGKIRAGISAITALELLQAPSLRNKEKRKNYELLLSPCLKISIDYQIASRAAEILRRFSNNGISPGDAILAATAEKHNLIICTRDRDFTLLATEAKIKIQAY